MSKESNLSSKGSKLSSKATPVTELALTNRLWPFFTEWQTSSDSCGLSQDEGQSHKDSKTCALIKRQILVTLFGCLILNVHSTATVVSGRNDYQIASKSFIESS